MRNLDPLRGELLDEGDHLFQMIEVLPVHDQIYCERNLVPADRAREFDFVRVRLGSGNPVGSLFPRILEADLDVIEAGLDQGLQPLLVEADARGDEVGIKSRGARGGDQLCQIGPHQRFAAGKVRMQHAQLAALLKDAGPLAGGKFRLRSGQLERIRAVDAVQRAAVRDFGDQGERRKQFSNCVI